MKKSYFKYKEHPNDLLRSSNMTELPNPNKNLQDFLIQFLHHYQSDQRVAYLDNLYKLLNDEFDDEAELENFIQQIGKKTKKEIINEIRLSEQKLKLEAYENFYTLVLTNQIEVIENVSK